MGQLRAVLDELLLGTGDIDEVLTRVDRLAARTPSMYAATVCVAVLDPASGALRYATCGHPPPLVVTPDGATRWLEATGGSPLGTGAPPRSGLSTLGPGEVLMVYSDGLVERPGQTLEDGQGRLAQVAGDAVAGRALPLGAPDSAAGRASQLSVELLTRTGYDDDVTLIAVQRRPEPVQPWQVDLTTDAVDPADLRAWLRDWLGQVEPTPRDEDSVQLAVTELVANAVEHAYPDGHAGPVQLWAELGSDGAVEVRVADEGAWREPDAPTATSGRGLWVAGEMVDRLSVEHPDTTEAHESGGTVVTLGHRLHHPALLASEPESALDPRSVSMEFATHLDEGPPRTITVSGPVDFATAEEFADRLTHASRGGVHSLTVDLSDVDMLASAGVRVLFEVRDQLATHDSALSVLADAGSPAHTVLDLVGLAHRPAHTAGQ